jgi:hypothetical protein
MRHVESADDFPAPPQFGALPEAPSSDNRIVLRSAFTRVMPGASRDEDCCSPGSRNARKHSSSSNSATWCSTCSRRSSALCRNDVPLAQIAKADIPLGSDDVRLAPLAARIGAVMLREQNKNETLPESRSQGQDYAVDERATPAARWIASRSASSSSGLRR